MRRSEAYKEQPYENSCAMRTVDPAAHSAPHVRALPPADKVFFVAAQRWRIGDGLIPFDARLSPEGNI
ncbi:hypothetical protein AGR7C_Lc60045 [Agrobacterium deltaense Zutra 3/1]|uniref:Uncharacterized protein n=1 Tax=Agrobacterium deltaense Zutra 3/1 TaxID=1183427 RepID=A0A1S7RX16_9HYPH|nr:hypothetical protein AGR7C_Lc60045 [Agrobacterium deltaense Zutra 3/1]